MSEQWERLELCLGMDDGLVESLWVRIRGQTLSAIDCPVRKKKVRTDSFPTGRKVFKGNLPCFNFCLLPLVLSVGITEKRCSIFFTPLHQVFIHIDKVSLEH